MFRIDKVRTLFNCDQCDELLVDPVTIACGNSVCKRHLEELMENSSCKKTFKCEVCHKKHGVPEDGFIVSKRIQNALDIKLNNMKLSASFYACRNKIEQVIECAAKVESISKDSETFISNYFEDIKRHADLKRKTLQQIIELNFHKVIETVEKTKIECIKLSKDSKQLSQNIQSLKLELKELTTKFDTFEIDELDYDDLQNSADILKEKFNDTIIEHKKSLLNYYKKTILKNHNKDYSLHGCIFFEKFVNIKKFESKILDSNQQRELVKLCELSEDKKWTLKYRASRDGFAAKSFHDKCDGIANTLTVIKTTKGYIFGGFTTKAWHSNGGTVTDHEAFLFSFVNKENKPFKVLCSDGGKYAIVCDSSRGPSFGSDGQYIKDIFISSDSNISHDNRSNFGYSYKHPDYLKGTIQAKSILAGSYKFQTFDIEVFSQMN